ncbi:MAG: hypothetical protein KJ737_06705 [Proteobacteria bacterium]|nr:hypothetical protein [Pseudomonadota bacterium]
MQITLKRMVKVFVIVVVLVGNVINVAQANDTDNSNHMILPLNETERATWRSFGTSGDDLAIQGLYSIAMFAGCRYMKIKDDNSEEAQKTKREAIEKIFSIEEKLGLRVMVAQSLYWAGQSNKTEENIADGIRFVMAILKTKYGKDVVQGHENYVVHLAERVRGLK